MWLTDESLSRRQPVTLGWLSQSYSCDDGVGEGQQSQPPLRPPPPPLYKNGRDSCARGPQPILRDFTKAVLRERPEDVLLFSRDYFVAKWWTACGCAHMPARALLLSLTEPSL